jgi:hypothetical protein
MTGRDCIARLSSFYPALVQHKQPNRAGLVSGVLTGRIGLMLDWLKALWTGRLLELVQL